VYFYQLGKILGAEPIRKYAEMLGLGKVTHIDLPYEKKGNIPSAKRRLFEKKRRWYQGDTLNLAIGQGDVLVTPLQLVKMMSIVANRGKIVQPHFIKKIGSAEVKDYDGFVEALIRKGSFETVHKGMMATVERYSGTAHVLNIDGLKVAGKTGTAQSTPNRDNHAWFVGYAEGKRRRIAFCVFLEHGGSSYNATLITRELLMSMMDNEKL